jgi:hypothetical protein
MLKKNAFRWTEEAKEAFLKLKSTVRQAPVLALPDFEEPFSLSVMLVVWVWGLC